MRRLAAGSYALSHQSRPALTPTTVQGPATASAQNGRSLGYSKCFSCHDNYLSPYIGPWRLLQPLPHDYRLDCCPPKGSDFLAERATATAARPP